MDAKTLKSFLKVMRAEGCIKLEMPELKIELVPEALLPRTESPAHTEPVAETQYPSQEEIDKLVFWSAPGPNTDAIGSGNAE